MLVQSGNNRNHYQAEVNSSSLQSNFAALPPRSSGESEVWSVGAISNSVNNQSGLTNSPSSPPPAESDSVNNNNHNTNNNSSKDSSAHRAVNNSCNNDNECASVILSELDLVASVNISLLKKSNPVTASFSVVSGSSSGAVSCSTPVGTVTTVPVSDGVCSQSPPGPPSSELRGDIKSVTTTNSLVGIPTTGAAVTTAPANPGASKSEKMSDAYLSGVKPETLKNNNNNLRQGPLSAPNTPETMRKHQMLLRRDLPALSHSMIVPHVSAKKEKMEFNQMMMKMNERDRPLSYHGRSSDSNSSPCILSAPVNKRHVGSSSSAARTRKEATLFNRRSMPSPYLENRFREKFDVSALDTNLPRIDLEAIENHLRLAREEERKHLSSRLKLNVVEKSSFIKDSLTQTFQPYLLNKKARGFRGSVDQDEDPGRRRDSGQRTEPSRRAGRSESDNCVAASHVPYSHYAQTRSSNSSKRGNPDLPDDRNRYRPWNGNGGANGLGPTLKWPMLQNASRTWTSDTKDAFYGRRWGRNNPDEDESCESTDEDEDITGRFNRVISIRGSCRRSDREEIRRRLALESEDVNEKPSGRKPSLHSRLQSTSDSESPNSDTEAKNQHQPASLPHVKAQPGNGNDSNGGLSGEVPSEDFYARQARLQAEARQALSQAKEMARLQMAQEREQRLTSPITDMVKNSLLKVGVTLPPERRRVSRQLLTEMNVAQLQVIVNDLHTHIEVLNETLVSMLLERDDLHMEQDSMLVDIEDLTRYLAAKDNSPHQSLPLIAPSRNLLGKK
ncbi:unnamed protein product [Allacma fusca]|uniref:Schwannomin interacting protein 1 C-terminal domain-containing protein n=1 Tax=Allacma fusca TaxID=39272 RepID=A0A8J2L1E9_9HEXA|nr:unnamed protein product [Allacma fusca]